MNARAHAAAARQRGTGVDDDLDTDAPVAPPGAVIRGPGPVEPAPASVPASAPVAAPVAESDRSGLTERDEQILAFERQWWRHAGAKEQAIRDTFDLSATRYYQLLNGLLDNPAALAHDPMLVKRLRRVRQSRRSRIR